MGGEKIPVLGMVCEPGVSGLGKYYHGHITAGFVNVGGVVDSSVGSSGGVDVLVQYRRDDDAHVKEIPAAVSKDYGMVVFNDFPIAEMGSLLYGHMIPHKRNTTPQTRKLILSIPQFVSTNVVVQFDLPDSDDVADQCGLINNR
jgi:hypothetical protein